MLADTLYKYVLDNTLGEINKFVARDVHSETCLPSYKFFNKISHTGGCMLKCYLKKIYVWNCVQEIISSTTAL